MTSGVKFVGVKRFQMLPQLYFLQTVSQKKQKKNNSNRKAKNLTKSNLLRSYTLGPYLKFRCSLTKRENSLLLDCV